MTNQELNEAVARKLGWTPANGKTFEADTMIKNYCTSIAAAWEICESLDSKQSHIRLARSPSTKGWLCNMNDASAEADTAAEAICRAFLKMG